MSRGAFRKGFLIGILAVFWAVGPVPVPALASCSFFGQGYGVTSPTTTTRYGVKVGQNLVINPSTSCGITRSIYIEDSSDNFVEVGWYEDDGPGGDGSPPCTDFGSPHVLVYAIVSGFMKCKSAPPGLPLAEPHYSFRVDNPDHDHDFVYYYDDDNTPDISLGFFATDHINGWTKAGDEGHDTVDSLRASFVPFESMGSGGAWLSGFPSPELFSSGNVGSWDVCSWSSLNLEVKLTC
jgi:hypothetical protein